MPDPERVIAGLSCRDVLADLTEYHDDTLSSERREQILLHLTGCDWCERFGGRFAEVIGGFRQGLRDTPPVSPETSQRLWKRLELELPQ